MDYEHLIDDKHNEIIMLKYELQLKKLEVVQEPTPAPPETKYIIKRDTILIERYDTCYINVETERINEVKQGRIPINWIVRDTCFGSKFNTVVIPAEAKQTGWEERLLTIIGTALGTYLTIELTKENDSK